jgi:hypothetical protein
VELGCRQDRSMLCLSTVLSMGGRHEKSTAVGSGPVHRRPVVGGRHDGQTLVVPRSLDPLDARRNLLRHFRPHRSRIRRASTSPQGTSTLVRPVGAGEPQHGTTVPGLAGVPGRRVRRWMGVVGLECGRGVLGVDRFRTVPIVGAVQGCVNFVAALTSGLRHHPRSTPPGAAHRPGMGERHNHGGGSRNRIRRRRNGI